MCPMKLVREGSVPWLLTDCSAAPTQIVMLTTANVFISGLKQITADSVETFPASGVIKVCGTTKMFARYLDYGFLQL